MGLTELRKALDDAGADANLVSPEADRVRSWNFTDWAAIFRSTCRSKRPIRTTSMLCVPKILSGFIE